MLAEKQLVKTGVETVRTIFEPEYLRDNRVGTLVGHGMVDDNTFMLFIGIKDKNDLPTHKASEKGWTVYAEIRIDATTGRVISRDYQTE